MIFLQDFSKNLGQWIISLVEDYPIPPEIKNLYFLIFPDIKKYHLEFGGRELKKVVIDYLEYCPLDSQFFACEYPRNLEEFILILEQAIDEQFINPIFSKIFENKNLYIAIYRKNYLKKIK